MLPIDPMMQRNHIAAIVTHRYYSTNHTLRDSYHMRPAKILFILFFFSAFMSACSNQPDKLSLVQEYANDESQFIDIRDMQVHYRDEGQGDVVILLHGTASSLHTWDQWSHHLKKHYRVIRLDLPGFGLTGPDPLDQYEVNNDVDFINNFMQKLALDKVHLVGSSLGGRISWEYSLQYPEQVKSLTLINSLGYPQESWPPAIQLAQWPLFDSLVANLSPRFMFDIGLKEIYFDAQLVDDKLIDRYYDLAHYPGNMDAFPKRVKAKLDTDSLEIKNISVPTLVLWGEEDRYFPVDRASDFNRDIKYSSLITYADVGHLPMEETPLTSVTDFMHFLTSTTFD